MLQFYIVAINRDEIWNKFFMSESSSASSVLICKTPIFAEIHSSSFNVQEHLYV